MSLTTQIDSPDSTFMRFAARVIPHSSAVTAVRDGEYRQAIKAESSTAGLDRRLARLMGTAIDFRLRLAFTTTDLVPPSAQGGHAALSRRHPAAAPLLAELTDTIGATLADAGPVADNRIELSGPIEDELIRLCVVAGCLDQLYRNYTSTIDTTPLLDEGRIVPLGQLTAQVPSAVVGQLREQVRTANAGLGPLRATATTATAGMTFTGSHLIGADADLLVDGLLLDFKARNEATTIKKPDVYQLAGYVLLDFDDAHHIEQVGVYWTRHGVMRTFTVPVFFELLGATASLAELRSELHDELRANFAAHSSRLQPTPLTPQAERNESVSIEQVQPHVDTTLARSVRWLRKVLRR